MREKIETEHLSPDQSRELIAHLFLCGDMMATIDNSLFEKLDQLMSDRESVPCDALRELLNEWLATAKEFAEGAHAETLRIVSKRTTAYN